MTVGMITKMIAELKGDDVKEAVQAEIDRGTSPQDILAALSARMNEVGHMYETMEHFLVELVLAGQTMKEAFAILTTHLKSGETGEAETTVVATVKADDYDVGNSILISMLMSTGYNIIGFGTDCHRV
jgi:methanogenic corrinoid protein MtbC1